MAQRGGADVWQASACRGRAEARPAAAGRKRPRPPLGPCSARYALYPLSYRAKTASLAFKLFARSLIKFRIKRIKIL